MNLARGSLGQLGDECDLARILVRGKLRAHQLLYFFDKRIVTLARGDDECLDDLATQRVGNADRRGFLHLRVLQDRVLDFDRAHRPAGGDDHVVGATCVIKIAVLVDAAEVLGGNPGVTAPHLQLADNAGRARLPFGSCTSTLPPGIGLPSEPGFTVKSSAPG